MRCKRTNSGCSASVIDWGPKPFVTDIGRAVRENSNYRTALWTGCHLQLTLMCIPVGGEIGLEVHPDTDQFICLEGGEGLAMLGPAKDRLEKRSRICGGSAVFVPAGCWHNIKNIGDRSLKLYTIYAPPHHPHGTIQRTKAEADAEED